MSNQRNDWHTLADRIAEKIQEYINEKDAWDKEPFLWVDGNTSEVNLGSEEESFHGEKTMISVFIIDDGNENAKPDYDQIDEYAYGWFDIRQD